MDLVQGASLSGRAKEGFCSSSRLASPPLHRAPPLIFALPSLPHLRHPGHGERSVSLISRAIKSLTDKEEEDLLQYKDRDQWYLPKFVADDAPDWNPGKFLRSRQLAPGVREVVLEAEISREQIPLRNAYKHIGQKASVRINSGIDTVLPVARGPFPQELNKQALFRARMDMVAGEIKAVKEVDSVKAELPLLVYQEDAPDVYKMAEDDAVEIGPFLGTGIDLRGGIISIYTYPTIVIFCEGQGIAAAKALVEAQPSEGGLNFPYREDVRLYYRAPNQDALCFRDELDEWESKYSCKVVTSTRGTFQDMFDDDDTLAYEPVSTAAIILTGGDEEAEAAALEVCNEAEITEIATDSREQTQSVYLVKGSEGPTKSDRKKDPPADS